MSPQGDWVSILQGMVQQMAGAGVTDLEVRRGGLRVRLRRDPEIFARSRAASRMQGIQREGESLHGVVAPLTGIYYAASNPTSRPYVSVGDWVEPETVVGLIETMKVFNEVTADCRGKVAAILVQQGQLIHAGETILQVDLGAAPDHSGEVAS